MEIQSRKGDYIIEENSIFTIKKDDALNKYDVLEKRGELQRNGYCVLNNIYVNSRNERAFEDRFLNRKSNLSTSEGFLALRVLKSQEDSYYVILSLWESQHSFEKWQTSSQYKQTHQKRGTSKGLDAQIIDRKLSHSIGFEVM